MAFRSACVSIGIAAEHEAVMHLYDTIYGGEPRLASRTQESAMEHQRSGRLRWDTTKAAQPGWLLFLDGQPGEAPTMLPGFETRVPRGARHAEVARLIAAMLQRETGHQPQRVQFTQIEPGPVYYFVATDESPA